MTIIMLETELTTMEIGDLVRQLDIEEQIEFVTNEIMSNWTQESSFDKIKAWIEQE